jgi:gliding motility-associated-like protein
MMKIAVICARFMKKGVLLLLISLIAGFLQLQAQCITSYPYYEDFEATNGNWTSGGTGNDWAWGQVSKSVISQAASGNNCWVQGGLTASFYNLGERSYLQSPCFDFTLLQYPYISFNIFWESERTYDGSNLQYSLNGGATWVNVGAYNEPVNCMTQNWYNTANINNLNNLVTVREGWAGNTQPTQGSCQGGSGSNGWKLAKHCLSNLAGQSGVIFRFTFGAGTACNDFDGIAFDDITIGEAPANTADFTYTCNGSSVTFTGITTQCPDNLQWDFGDGSTATGLTATHTFTTAGPHNVTFTANGPCNAPGTVTKQITGVTVTPSAVDVNCNGGNDGKAVAFTNSSGGPFTYQWNTNPTQTTDTAFNLNAGTYTVTVSGANVCAGTASVTINQPSMVGVSLSATPDTCSVGVGAITANATGGNGGYQFSWSNGATGNQLTQLVSGSYSVTVTDAKSCSASATVSVPLTSGISILFTDVRNVSCLQGNDGSVTAVVVGGTSPYQYQWSNNTVADKADMLPPGVYTVTVTDAVNCSNSNSVEVEKVGCESYVDFPTGFSPNGDGVNDVFRARYSYDVRKFALRIYNRWGELVFETADVNEGWNGIYKAVAQPMSVYVWVAEYSFLDGSRNAQSGNVSLIR